MPSVKHLPCVKCYTYNTPIKIGIYLFIHSLSKSMNPYHLSGIVLSTRDTAVKKAVKVISFTGILWEKANNKQVNKINFWLVIDIIKKK